MMRFCSNLRMERIGGPRSLAGGRFFIVFLLGAIAIMALAGCGGPAPASRPTFVPIRPDPTATPTLASSQPAGVATSVVSDAVDSSRYTHPSQRFSINYPDNWQFFEQDDGVVFIDPGNQAGYSVTFNDADQVYSDQELKQYLVSFVAKNFAREGSDFTALGEENKANGVKVARFSSRDSKLGQQITEVRMQQQDTILFVLLINATPEQWKISHQKLQALADTFTPLDTQPAVEAEPTEELPVWVLIGPTTSAFGFFYPSDWEILRQDENSVAVGMPETDLIFEARVVEVDEKTGEDAEEVALAYLKELSEEYKNVQNVPPQEFPLDTMTGATVDFLYQTPDGTNKAGSIITAIQDGKVYQVTFSSSAGVYQGALQWFNPMYKSFKVLPVEEVVVTPEP